MLLAGGAGAEASGEEEAVETSFRKKWGLDIGCLATGGCQLSVPL